MVSWIAVVVGLVALGLWVGWLVYLGLTHAAETGTLNLRSNNDNEKE